MKLDEKIRQKQYFAIIEANEIYWAFYSPWRFSLNNCEYDRPNLSLSNMAVLQADV